MFFVIFFFFGLDLTHSYPAHLPTLINIVPTLVPYLLSPIVIATFKTSYLTDLNTILTTYINNLTTLLITYLTNLIIVPTTQ